MKIKHLFLLLFVLNTIAGYCQNPGNQNREQVKITTPYGTMLVELYNETPGHRDNFIKLANEGFFDSLLFHRVINEFMIQGGDPESRNAEPGKRLGNGGPGYQIDAEFVDTIIHRKGALAAAREGDRVNPLKKSSGSQFYIVQGKVFSEEILDKIEGKQNQKMTNSLINKYVAKPENKKIKKELDSLQQNKLWDQLNQRFRELEEHLKSSPDYKPFKFSALQRQVYTSVGGTPHLDGNYTVFGQVVEGFAVIDSIAAQKTDKFDRPMMDIPMEINVIR